MGREKKKKLVCKVWKERCSATTGVGKKVSNSLIFDVHSFLGLELWVVLGGKRFS